MGRVGTYTCISRKYAYAPNEKEFGKIYAENPYTRVSFALSI